MSKKKVFKDVIYEDHKELLEKRGFDMFSNGQFAVPFGIFDDLRAENYKFENQDGETVFDINGLGLGSLDSIPSIQGWSSTLVFTALDYNTVKWNAASIILTTGETFSISLGNTGSITQATYIYLDVSVSTTQLQTTTTAADSVGADKILVAVAFPNADTSSLATFQAFGGQGGVTVLADNIVANSLSTNEFITNTAQIKDAIVTNAKIDSLAVSKLTAGTILSKIFNLAVQDGSGDSYIAAGKTDFTNSQSGFILGVDDSDGNKAKLYIGDSSNYLNWTGTGLSLKGSIVITGGSGIGSLSDAGALATLDSVGYTNCDSTLISGGYIATPRLYANNIQAGTFIGRDFKANNGSGSDIWIQNDGFIRWRYGGGTKAYNYVDTSGNFIISADEAMILDFNENGGTSYGFEISEDSGSAMYIGGDKSADFANDVDIAGTLSKGGGSFKIDHPLKPKTHYLFHSFVESPDMLNIYKGRSKTKNKKATIELPDYFEALNKDFEYQLTPIKSLSKIAIKSEVKDNKFEVMVDEDCEFSWQVTGVRKDRFALTNPIITEVEKKIKGYIHPELWEDDFDENKNYSEKFIEKTNIKRKVKLQVKRNFLKRKAKKEAIKNARIQKKLAKKTLKKS